MKFRLLVAALTTATAALAPATGASASAEPDCATPTVNVLSEGEAAVSRPAINSPSEYGLSNVYAQNSLATKPQFVYAEAGPQYAGAFEALAPAGSPPPPRAVSAYPSEDIPDEDEETWGGTSATRVSPVSAFAFSAGSQDLGLGDTTAENGSAFVTTVVECDTVTVIAGWTANDVVVAPGLTYEQMGETVTLVVGPEGSSAEVQVTLVGGDGESLLPLEGRPADPFTDPIRENGGPTVEAGEPRTENGDGYASASGGGFNFLFADPETGQGAGYRIGSVNATIEVLGAIAPPSPVATTSPTTAPPVIAAANDTPAPRSENAVGTTTAVTGTPPEPSPVAVTTIDTVLVRDTHTMVLEVEERSWVALFALLGLLALAGSSWGAVAVGRHRFPTLDWIARNSSRGSRRFVTQYLRW